MDDHAARLGASALTALRRLVRERVARKTGGHLIEENLGDLPLEVDVPLPGSTRDPEEYARRLVESVDAVLDGAIRQAVAFRPGRAFCHRCGGSDCEHSLPPSSRHVLIAYAPTGVPRWEDFAQYCLDRRHDDVDRLYDDPPAFLTFVLGPRDLRGSLLDAFEDPGYRLLGQLAAGFFPVRTREDEGRGVVAVTIQVAASTPKKGPVRLGLNLLGRAPSGEELGALWDRHRDLPWRRGVRWAQAALRTVKTGRRLDERLQGRVDGILRGLARRLERSSRARTRRTNHAERRHESGRRPTRKALEDLREARADSFLVDERSGTVVVLGDRGRTHFFNPEGRHVSSVTYSRDAIGRKIKLGIWREASGEEADALRRRLEGPA